MGIVIHSATVVWDHYNIPSPNIIKHNDRLTTSLYTWLSKSNSNPNLKRGLTLNDLRMTWYII